MINIICLGKIKEIYLNQMVEDYKGRISKYHKINIIELKDENILEKEALNIMKYISPKDYVIACDIKGESMSSEDFARVLDNAFINSGTIDFVIGSSYKLF
jgi:23S rRNA (pseudouridine1915-N3)-methyltransferase